MSSQKEAAVNFLKLVVNKQVRDAYEKYIAPDFIHHNAFFKGDRESLLRAMDQNNETNPNKQFDVKFVYEDGDTVITHSHVRPKPEDLGAAVVHIFKFKAGKVVELWDLGQPIQKDSPNENGPF